MENDKPQRMKCSARVLDIRRMGPSRMFPTTYRNVPGIRNSVSSLKKLGLARPKVPYTIRLHTPWEPLNDQSLTLRGCSQTHHL